MAEASLVVPEDVPCQRPLWGRAPRVLESSPIPRGEEATEYDRKVRRDGWLMHRRFAALVSQLGLERGRVLDIGTGPGSIPIALALRNPNWEIWGLDASPDMLACARQYAAQAALADRVRFVAGDACALPFAAGYFDLVISHFTLHHIDRPEAMFNEAARVVRGGGKVIIQDLCRPPRWQAALFLAFSKYVLRDTEPQLNMYRESLAAALTMAELRAALRNSQLAMANVRRFRGREFVVSS